MSRGNALLRTLSTNEAGYSVSKVSRRRYGNTDQRLGQRGGHCANHHQGLRLTGEGVALRAQRAEATERDRRERSSVIGDWPIIEATRPTASSQRIEHEDEQTIYLDGRHEAIVPDPGRRVTAAAAGS